MEESEDPAEAEDEEENEPFREEHFFSVQIVT